MRLQVSALLSLWLFTQTDVQLAQCLGIHYTRSLGHDIGRALGFRERDHFTNRLGAGHQHHQAVQAKGQATVGRCTVLQSIEQEAEFLFLFRFTDAQQTEDRLLHFLAMDTDRTATQLGAVQDHVVSA